MILSFLNQTKLTSKGKLNPMWPYFFYYLGLFGIFTTLSIILQERQLEVKQIGLAVFLFTAAYRIARLPLAPFFDQHTSKVGMLVGCLVSLLGLLLFGISTHFSAVVIALLILGTGLSVNDLSMKRMVAHLRDLDNGSTRALSMAYIVANTASIISPPIALWLVSEKYTSLLFMLLIGLYLIAGILTLFLKLAADSEKTTFSLSLYRKLLAKPGLISALTINAMGRFLQGQLFYSITLYAGDLINQKTCIGLLYTLASVLVVLFQLIITKYAELAVKKLQRPYASLMPFAYIIYGLAFVLAAAWSGPGGVVGLIVAFTIAEMIFLPSMEVLFLRMVGKKNRSVSYSLLSLSNAIGESLGASVGIFTYKEARLLNSGQFFWLLLAMVAFLFSLGAFRLIKRNSSLASMGVNAHGQIGLEVDKVN